MPRYINPHRGVVMVQGPNGVIKVRPGMVVDLTEAQAARSGLQITGDDDIGKPEIAPRSKGAPAMPPRAAERFAAPVAAPKLPEEPAIKPAPAEEKEPEAPVPAAEPAASAPEAGLTEPAKPETPVDEKAADEVARDLVGEPAKPRKQKKDKGEPKAKPAAEPPAAPEDADKAKE